MSLDFTGRALRQRMAHRSPRQLLNSRVLACVAKNKIIPGSAWPAGQAVTCMAESKIGNVRENISKAASTPRTGEDLFGSTYF